MNPDDDPEQRIRELERPLTDLAQAGELSTANPPGGWPSVASAASSGMRIGWIMLALLVVGLFVGGGVIVWTNMSDRSAPGTPTVSGGGGTFSAPTPTTPSSSTATVATPAPGGSFSVAGVNQNTRVTCDDSLVTISGMDNTVTITGNCRLVQVSGMNNVVTIDAANTIDASGMDNKVTYRSGSPTINRSGFGNTVEHD